MLDPEPQPGDGPDYHTEHAFWLERNPKREDKVSEEVTSSLTNDTLIRHKVVIRVVEDLAKEGEEPDLFTMHDEIWATWIPKVKYDDSVGSYCYGYWQITGDNTGSEALIVHPYMVEPLKKLLNAIPDMDTDA